MKIFGHSGHHSAAAIKPRKPRAKQLLAAGAAGAVILAGGIVASNSMYRAAGDKTATSPISSYSATDQSAVSDFQAASRGQARGTRGSDAGTVSVKVVINGETQYVLGTDFTDVKSVLSEGNISLDPTDEVSPALTEKVSESTVITITRPNAAIETVDQDIPFNTIEQETDELPAGTTKVKTEGKNGTMELTNLVQKNKDKVISRNTLTAYVKTAPTDKIVLVGTGSASTGSGSTGSGSGSANLGTTVPAGEMQSWAHDYLLANGYTEDDFTALVFIITHESGWNPQATNPSSGAYGLPQALPGSKMASAGADWQTNYQTQIKWFLDYCNQRYGGVTAAYNHWQAYKSY